MHLYLENRTGFFTLEAWTLSYPNTVVVPLARTTSDHTPCVIKIGTSIPRSNIFRFENFWLEHSHFKQVVKDIWEQPVPEQDNAKMISAKFKRLRKGLKNWFSKISDLKGIIRNTNEVIFFYDSLEEFRQLSSAKASGRAAIKDHLAKVLAFQKTYWKQRATIRAIKVGEANTKYFQAKATIKLRNNCIVVLKDSNGIERQHHQTKAAILSSAFKERLGSHKQTDNPLLLHNLIQLDQLLEELEVPFTHEEIDTIIK